MDKRDVIDKVLSYIEEHLEQEITLDKIAEEVCYSKFYIARMFKETVGCTLYKYVQSRRLTEAALQLVETDKPIIEIAYDAHYTSQQAFTKAFVQEYICTPQIYRKKQVFYPKQSKVTMRAGTSQVHGKYTFMGGRMAA